MALSVALCALSACEGCSPAHAPELLPPQRKRSSGDTPAEVAALRAGVQAPFRKNFDPANKVPGPRQAKAMSAEQLAAQLQRAAAAQTQRKRADALAELRGCANLEPPQLPCESRLALVLAEDRARPAEMEYYLTAAIRGEPSPLTAADYEALGRTASRKGLHELAVIAFDKRLALKEDGQGYALLGEALQGIPARMEDAIDALAKAQTLEPTRTQLSLDRATLLHQRGRFKEAAEALVYVAERESDATKRASLLAQVKKLRSSAEAAGSAH